MQYKTSDESWKQYNYIHVYKIINITWYKSISKICKIVLSGHQTKTLTQKKQHKYVGISINVTMHKHVCTYHREGINLVLRYPH